MPSITTQTRLDNADAQFIAFLDAMATKFGVVERTSFAAINKGLHIDVAFENKLQQDFGLSSQDVRNAITKAEGNYKSQKELIVHYITQTKSAISSIKETIKKFEKKIEKLESKGKKKQDLLRGIPKLKFKLHQKQRSLARKEAALWRLNHIRLSPNVLRQQVSLKAFPPVNGYGELFLNGVQYSRHLYSGSGYLVGGKN